MEESKKLGVGIIGAGVGRRLLPLPENARREARVLMLGPQM